MNKLSYQLLVFLNATTVICRGLPGFVAKMWGRFNMMIVSSFASTIMILSLWMFTGDNLALLVTFTVLFDIFSGTAHSLTPVCVAQLCQQENYATRYGTAYRIAIFATLIGKSACWGYSWVWKELSRADWAMWWCLWCERSFVYLGKREGRWVEDIDGVLKGEGMNLVTSFLSNRKLLFEDCWWSEGFFSHRFAC